VPQDPQVDLFHGVLPCKGQREGAIRGQSTVRHFCFLETFANSINQLDRDLERAVEDLSELLESPIEPDTIPTLRQSVTNKTVYVQKRNEIVLEDTANGFLEGRWKWNVAVDGFDDPEESVL